MLLVEHTTSRFSSFSLTRFRLSVMINQLEKNCLQHAFKHFLLVIESTVLTWEGRAGRCIYIKIERKSPSCYRFLPPAIRIACGVVSAHSGGPYSCSSLCGTASFCGLEAGMEPVGFEGERTWRDLARDVDLRQAPVQR